MKPVTCIDCKHNKASWIRRHINSPTYWDCNIGFVEPEYNPADGKTRPGFHRSCTSMRILRECGPEGKLWEPRDPKKRTFFLLKKDHNATTA
jgi:hypothetical protein